ncbi:MAG: nitroreductase [Deltaproteobacteria bacterium]|nr:MAG: nitroreductase [Deltaproteobacteria bacterium]
MNVTDAVLNRVSTRAFLKTPVPEATLKRILETAQRAPSNCNVQPWDVYVVSGAAKDTLKGRLAAAVISGAPPNPDFNWQVKYDGRHKERQYGSAHALYSAMGIERSDKKGRLEAMLKNWSFFDAPHALFLTMETYLDIMGAVDLGIYVQTLCLLMEEEGISTCIQGALGQFPDPVRASLNLPDSSGILFGMSFGYADPDAPVNTCRTDRIPAAEAVTFIS